MFLFLTFLYSFLLMLILPILVSNIKFAYFAPFLICNFYRTSKKSCIWLALAAGLAMDLFSAQMRFGIYALNYTLTTALLFNFKNYFFENSVTTLPLMTLIFTYVSALTQFFLLYLLTSKNIMSGYWFRVELIELPIFNALYALCTFGLISFLFPYHTKKTPVIIKFNEKR